ncbi:MAG TPA: eight-cysteine-cluster domain-containing protein, partial [Candidatus Altiarchaeales archaeon]|nr:eight-cysteine-cluster domain-containing protein [Candidatus Altiarchaeales archaeon]
FSNLVCKLHLCSECYCKDGKCESWLSLFNEAIKKRNASLCAKIKPPSCRDLCYDYLETHVEIKTDKTEYEQGEKVEIKVVNNLDKPIIYNEVISCGLSFWRLERFENGEWKEVYYRIPCKWEYPQHHPSKLDPNETLEYVWDGKIINSTWELDFAPPGRYRIVFPYGIPKIFETKELGNLICEVYPKIPVELEELLKNGNWKKLGNESCIMKMKSYNGTYKICAKEDIERCWCRCVAKDVWSINDIVKIDIENVSCYGKKYHIKFKNETYHCYPEDTENYQYFGVGYLGYLEMAKSDKTFTEFIIKAKKPDWLISTYGKCKTDEDCYKSGCSGEICQSKFEEPQYSICIARPLPENFYCKCIDGRCQWVSNT